MPFWLLRGRAHLEAARSRHASMIDAATAALRRARASSGCAAERARRRPRVVLATASHRAFADAVAAPSRQLFDEVARDRRRCATCPAASKARRAAANAYGDARFRLRRQRARATCTVWRSARAALIVVNARPSSLAAPRSREVTSVRTSIAPRHGRVARRLTRAAPAPVAEEPAAVRAAADGAPLLQLDALLLVDTLIYGASSPCARFRGVYVLNDLLDLDADRAASDASASVRSPPACCRCSRGSRGARAAGADRCGIRARPADSPLFAAVLAAYYVLTLGLLTSRSSGC